MARTDRVYAVVNTDNLQPEEYVELAEDPFISIQGEGIYNQGRPAVFIRFYGCNLKCYFCDTLHAVLKRYRERNVSTYSYETIFNWLENDLFTKFCTDAYSINKLVVFTGGEPFYSYNLPRMLRIIEMLLENSKYRDRLDFAVETNGLAFNSNFQVPELLKSLGSRLTISISPKIYQFRLLYKDYRDPDFGDANKEYKFVLDDLNNYNINGTLKVLNTFLNKSGVIDRDKVIIQPLHNIRIEKAYLPVQYRKLAEQCIKYGLRFNLQLHKVLDLK